MKSIKRDKHIQVRFTEPEVIKFRELARENGLTLSGFARYSMAKAARLIKTNKDEVTTN
ncbi:hypothetical protein N9V61_04125 [Flavobacteriaceae bacterium]|nr:hypothetical protein [Flavobacteriaceae bacterium]